LIITYKEKKLDIPLFFIRKFALEMCMFHPVFFFFVNILLVRALYTMMFYGYAHRDIKTENVLLHLKYNY
jgi:hypothetical protein